MSHKYRGGGIAVTPRKLNIGDNYCHIGDTAGDLPVDG